jgi:chromosome segregation ATPase
MVSITMGKMWGGKVEEIANLKIAKQELKEQLADIKQKHETLESEIVENRKAKEASESKYYDIEKQFKMAQEVCEFQDKEILRLTQINNENEICIQDLKSNLNNLQLLLDTAQASLHQSLKLEQDLRNEIKHGEAVRNRLEIERDRFRADFEKKCSDFEILSKSKDHCERHIAILLKDKDRLVNKSDAKPALVSKIYENIQPEEKITTWGQVENLRLKSLLDQEKKDSEAKSAQIEKLQKENWNLINRLRNKKNNL